MYNSKLDMLDSCTDKSNIEVFFPKYWQFYLYVLFKVLLYGLNQYYSWQFIDFLNLFWY